MGAYVIHIFMDNAMTAAIFQIGKGRDNYIQVCARQLWLICADLDITLRVTPILASSS